MNNEKYDEEIKKGRQMIEARLREIAAKANLQNLTTNWVAPPPGMRGTEHKLQVSVGELSYELKFSDDEVSDYPAGVGTTMTNENLYGVVDRLKE